MLALRRFPGIAPIELRREFDRLFDGLLGDGFATLSDAARIPLLNLWEDGDKLVAEVEVPGLAMDELEILVHDNNLVIKGQYKAAGDDKTVYHRRERTIGEFTRCLTLPVEVDAERVEATLKDGLLRIELPKAAKARARKIEVKTA